MARILARSAGPASLILWEILRPSRICALRTCGTKAPTRETRRLRSDVHVDERGCTHRHGESWMLQQQASGGFDVLSGDLLHFPHDLPERVLGEPVNVRSQLVEAEVGYLARDRLERHPRPARRPPGAVVCLPFTPEYKISRLGVEYSTCLAQCLARPRWGPVTVRRAT